MLLNDYEVIVNARCKADEEGGVKAVRCVGRHLTIPGFAGYRFFIDEREDGWWVWELSTGMAVTTNKPSFDDAVKAATGRLHQQGQAKLDKAIAETIEKYGRLNEATS
jgi:hypothetical protein